jgi:hypothetical protein
MGIRGWAILLVALGGAGPCANGEAQTAIPRSQGTTLTGTMVVFPDVLKGKVGVLLVGFSRDSKTQVAAWGKRLEADYGKSDDVVYFEMPMIGGAPRLVRGMIVKSMSSSVPAAERPHFLPMVEGEPAWRAVAHYDKPNDAYVLLLDGTGTVEWQTEGDATDTSYATLKRQIETQKAGH